MGLLPTSFHAKMSGNGSVLRENLVSITFLGRAVKAESAGLNNWFMPGRLCVGLDNLSACAMHLIVFEQPKLALLPEGQRGGPKSLGSRVRGRGARLSRLVGMAKVTFKTEPVS